MSAIACGFRRPIRSRNQVARADAGRLDDQRHLGLQSGFAWAPDDATSMIGPAMVKTLDSAIPSPNNGVWQSWNYSGPHSAFSNGANPIPCYGALAGCTALHHYRHPAILADLAAAEAPYEKPHSDYRSTPVPTQSSSLLQRFSVQRRLLHPERRYFDAARLRNAW